jgi:hypothetical protein
MALDAGFGSHGDPFALRRGRVREEDDREEYAPQSASGKISQEASVRGV